MRRTIRLLVNVLTLALLGLGAAAAALAYRDADRTDRVTWGGRRYGASVVSKSRLVQLKVVRYRDPDDSPAGLQFHSHHEG